MSTRTFLRPVLAAGVLAAAFAAPAAAQTTHVVDAQGFSFIPNTLTIEVGDTVQWTGLAGTGSHNVEQVDCPPSSTSLWNGGFRSGAAGTVPTFEVTFDTAGEFCYICSPHVIFNMFGTITVEDSDPWSDLGGGTTGANGAPTLTATGNLQAGNFLSVDLVNAPPGELMIFWLAFPTSTPVSAFGGTVHAFPFNTQLVRFADGAGAFSQGLPWPAGIPAGIDLYMQFIIQDLSVIHGATLSNAVTATTP